MIVGRPAAGFGVRFCRLGSRLELATLVARDERQRPVLVGVVLAHQLRLVVQRIADGVDPGVDGLRRLPAGGRLVGFLDLLGPPVAVGIDERARDDRELESLASDQVARVVTHYFGLQGLSYHSSGWSVGGGSGLLSGSGWGAGGAAAVGFSDPGVCSRMSANATCSNSAICSSPIFQ